MRSVLAVQPDLATTSVALFELAGWQTAEPFERVLGRLRMTDVIRTAPNQSLPVRLRALAGGLDRILAAARDSLWAVSVVYLELPRLSDWHESIPVELPSDMTASELLQAFLASGALMAAAVTRGVEVRIVDSPEIARCLRRRLVARGLATVRHSLPLDQASHRLVLDAIWLGATCLTNAGQRPLPMV
jgi:hypothetical protein